MTFHLKFRVTDTCTSLQCTTRMFLFSVHPDPAFEASSDTEDPACKVGDFVQ